jgi:hypothetical protein
VLYELLHVFDCYKLMIFVIEVFNRVTGTLHWSAFDCGDTFSIWRVRERFFRVRPKYKLHNSNIVACNIEYTLWVLFYQHKNALI